MKTMIIGDIHGQSEQFDGLLKRMRFSSETDNLILLGDLIDRGRNSFGVVQRVMDLKEEMGARLVILRGSHENLFLSHERKDKLLWYLVGCRATVRSFLENGEELFLYADWFRKNTVLYYVGDRFQCVHAAVENKPPTLQNEYTLMMNHSLAKKNQYRGKLTMIGHLSLPQPTYFDGSGGNGKPLPYGQTLMLPEHGIICLDTGCGRKRRPLTGMVIDEDEYRLMSCP